MIRLPRELWDIILEGFTRKDLLKLCLTNAELRNIAEPHLYKNIELFWHEHEPLPLVPLVRTLFRRRDLALHAQKVTLDSRNHIRAAKPSNEQNKVEMRQDAVDDLCLASRELLPVSLHKDLEWALQYGGRTDALVTLLLALTTNLVRLDLSNAFAREPVCMAKLLTHIGRSANTTNSKDATELPLQKVVHLVYQPRYNMWRSAFVCNTNAVLSWFHLPALQAFAVDLDSSYTFAWPLLPSSPPLLENLTSLTLNRARGVCLGAILQQTTRLERLCWGWIYEAEREADMNENVLELDELGDALVHVRDTLTSLKLQGELKSVCGILSSSTGSLRQLATFSKLKTIEAASPFFLGFLREEDGDTRPPFVIGASGWDHLDPIWECLPLSLVSLSLTDDFENDFCTETTPVTILEVLRVWWRDYKSTWTPNLKFFEVMLEQLNEWETEEYVSELNALGDECNVDVEMVCRNFGIVESVW